MFTTNISRPRLTRGVVATSLIVGALCLTTLFAGDGRVHAWDGFAVFLRPANLNFGESIVPTSPGDTYGRALLVAFANTLWVSLNSCVLATVLGIVIASAARSRLIVLRRIQSIYVEVFRNTPLLLQLLLWYTVLQSLPPVRHALRLGDVFVSQRGIALPALALNTASLAAIVIASICWIMAMRVPAFESPASRRTFHAVAAVVIGSALVLGLTITRPTLVGFDYRGGWRVSPEFMAVVIGITLYSAAFISEIVRSGIDAVPSGQWEASFALGFGRIRCLRLVVLPQAARVSLPPLVSEYAGIVKNSSLAVAIGYPDLIWASNTTITQTGHAIETIAVVMALYLSVSTAISISINLFNHRMLLRYA